MASFRLDLPADPRWLHVVQTLTVATAASSLPMDAGQLDDVGLVVREVMLSVATTVGVTDITVDAGTDGASMRLEVLGRGDGLDYEADGLDLIDVALSALTQHHDISRGADQYRISLGFDAAAA